MKKILFLLAVITFMAARGHAQANIHYKISFPNYRHHEAQVQLVVDHLSSAPATFRMSRSSAGRYATAEFGKNVYDVKAFDNNDHPLPLERVAGDIYKVTHHPSTIKITYTLYGDYADGTYDGIDSSGAHLNMPATCMWIEGHDQEPITFEFDMPQSLHWKVASQLKPLSAKNTYYARNFQYMMDSPTELSDYHLRTWTVKNPDGKIEEMRLALHTKASDSLVDAYTAMEEKVVKEEAAVFGELPDYDYGTYTFIENVNPFVYGDGMEHRNSTFITYRGQLADNVMDVLSTSSHEFFHCWNVKRIRPRDIEPFDFKEADMSSSLWFAEGFTQYYGELVLQRAGFKNLDEYCRILGGMLNYVLNSPGSKQFSPVTMSNEAVFTDAGVSIDRTNYPNIFTTYYYYGAVTALALDFKLRSDYHLTLDDYMRAVWKRFGKPYIPYTNDGLEKVLGEMTKDPSFAKSFFDQYIYGTQKNDYKKQLENAGLDLVKSNAGKAWMGNFRTEAADNGLRISSNTLKDQPIYNAGLDYDDLITELDGKAVTRSSDIDSILAAHQPGDKISVKYIHREVPNEAEISLQEDPALKVVTYEEEGKPVTQAIEAFRKAWLGSKVGK
ncbi:MAG TPA: PDZ domain-containing protein [Hanamia sp.]|nr:PDZ domain-containing protein [Hanamia sp.]